MKNSKGIYFEMIGIGLLVALIALAPVVGIFATIPTSAMTVQKGNQTMINKNMTTAGGMMATGNMTPPNKR